MGLQNGMGLTYCGTVMRTTHVTGVATDIGSTIGRNIGRRFAGIPTLHEEANAELLSFFLLCLLMSGYMIGGIAGAYALEEFGDDAILGPAAVMFIGGAAYTVYAGHSDLMVAQARASAARGRNAASAYAASAGRGSSDSLAELRSMGIAVIQKRTSVLSFRSEGSADSGGR
jgi:uncharacterized membrane protein YfcA